MTNKTYTTNLLLALLLLAVFSFAPQAARAAVLPHEPNNLGLVGYWTFNEGSGVQAADYSGNGNTASLSGTLVSDFNTSTGGWAFDCGGSPTTSIVSDAFEGAGSLRLSATAGDGLACGTLSFNSATGTVLSFAAKGNGSPSICVYNGSSCDNGSVTAVDSVNGWTIYQATLTATRAETLYIYSNGIGNYVQYDYITTGPMWKPGRHNKALSLNGSTAYAGLSNTPSLNISGGLLTISAWFKTTTVSGTHMILTKGAYGVHWNYGMGFTGTSLISRYSNGDLVSSAVTVNANVWHNLTEVYTSTSTQFFYDGILVDTKSNNGWSAAVGTQPLTIGASYTNVSASYSENFSGLIDDVRIYNRSLSPTDVSNLYTAGQVVRKAVSNNGLVGYWPLNEGRGTQAGDFSGKGNTGTLSGTTLPSWTSGKRGGALSFDGSTSYVTIPNISIANSITVSAWVYSNNFSQNGFVVGKNPVNTEWEIFFEGSLLRWRGGTPYNNAIYCSNPSNNQWHHIVGTQTGTTAALYIDGVQCSTGTTTAIANDANPIDIGRFNGGYYFNGKIDDVRIYNRVLSSTEIATLASMNETNINHNQNSRLTSGLVGYWSFNGPDMTSSTSTDVSGNGNNGTLVSSPQLTPGKVGQGIKFNGSSSYISVPNSASLNPSFLTISLWAKSATSTWNDYGFLFSKRDVYVMHPNSGGTSVSFYINNGSWNASTCTPTGPITDWTMYTMTWDGTNLKCYINAVLGASTQPGGSIVTSDTGELDIGKDDSLARYFNGSEDEVRMYNRALSAAEIQQLYLMGK